jgi:zinc protease
LVRAGLATAAFAGLNENRLGVAVMQFSITPAAGQTITDTYTLLRAELQDVIENGVTEAELARAKQRVVLGAITSFRGNVADTAEWLQDAALRLVDPAQLPAEVARYNDVTMEDIQRVAQTYLCERPLNVVTVLQEGEAVTATRPDLDIDSPPLPPDPREQLPPGVVNRYAVPASLPSDELSVPEFVTFTLENGLEIIFVEQHKTPQVNLSLYVGGSEPALPADQQGVAQLLAALLTKGTTTRSAVELAETIEGVGGRLSASALSEMTGVFASGPSTESELIFDLLADVARNPAFPEDQFTVERDRLLNNMRFDTSNPGILATRQFNRAVYPGHPYSFHRTPESVNAITTESLREFHERFYHPNNALLVIVGDLTVDSARAAAEEAFGDWQAGETPAFLNYPPVERPTEPVIYLVDRPNSEQSSLRIGNLALRADDPDRYAFEVGNTVLGGSGLASRLNKNLREDKGYTYGVFSGYTRRQDRGAFIVSGDVGPAVTGAAVREILRELEQIRNTAVTAEELAQAQGMMIGQFTMRIADPAALAEELAVRSLYGIPLHEIRDRIGALEAVTTEQVLDAARTHIDLDAPVIVVVGDVETVKPQLQTIGEVTVVDVLGNIVEIAPAQTEPDPAASEDSVGECVCPPGAVDEEGDTATEE